jgi:hypothetical protein
VARAPRHGSWAAEYAHRIARFQREHPGASRTAARGHAAGGDDVRRLLRRVGELPPGSQIAFTGIDRQPDGTWQRARFDVFGADGEESTAIVEPDQLFRLSDIRDAIAATGIAVLGADYLEAMVKWAEEQEPPPPPPRFAIESPRSGRFVSGVSKRGNALTKKLPGDALISTDRRRIARFLRAQPQLARRGYRIIAI